MFGIYSDKRISKQESKILYENPDDYNWYMAYVSTIFKDSRFFQVREDIELPQDEDDNGVVLMFEGGDVVYFKTLDGDVTDDEVKSIVKVCKFLEDTFKRPINAYVVFPPDAELVANKFEYEGELTMYFSSLRNDNGEEIVERLESKLKNNEKFTVGDSVDHMLLPYTGFKDKSIFEKKFESYMKLVNEYGG